MSDLLSEDELKKLAPAEEHGFGSPIPTQPISNGEFFPGHQTKNQQHVEALIKDYGDSFGKKFGMERRQFFKTAAGMAAAFLAMNKVYGSIFDVNPVEAATLELADERAKRYAGQFIVDIHTHFVRDDCRSMYLVKLREFTGRAGWNPELAKEPQTMDDLKFGNYIKEMFLDSDTKIALLSGAPSDIPTDWLLTNRMIADARNKVNAFAGGKRMMGHAVIAPGQKGWLEDIDRAIEELKPDAWKGYTIGDAVNPVISKYPWRMDDEKLVDPAYEKFLKSGIKNVAVHKGLYPPDMEKQVPNLTQYAKVDDVGKAAKDWPQLNFCIYHAGYRYGSPPLGGATEQASAEFEKTGRLEWVSDLVEIPQKYGVTNVYADIGTSFSLCCITNPRVAAAMVGMLVKGMGADRVCWGTDSLWYGSPQWQIEAMRRLEIPEDMQKRYGYPLLGAADGETKQKIFGLNSARLFGLDASVASAWKTDRIAERKTAYLNSGPDRSNLAYGLIRKIDS
jgi:hypothetical protein